MSFSKRILLTGTIGLLGLSIPAMAQTPSQNTNAVMTKADYDDMAIELKEAEFLCKRGDAGSWQRYSAARKKLRDAVGTRIKMTNDIDIKNGGPRDTLEEEQSEYYLNKFQREFPPLDQCPPTPPKVDKGVDLTNTVFGVLFGFSGHNPPQAGYGVQITPGDEKFVAKSDNQLTGHTLGGYLLKDKLWYFGASYTDTDGYAEGQIANGTDNVGIVYHDDAVGSTGVALGPRGLDVKVSSEYTGLNFLANRKFTYSQKEFYAGMGILVTDTKHKATITTPSFPDIRSESEQNIDETFFYIHAGTEIPIFSNANTDGIFGFSLLPQLEAGLRHAELSSRQWNMCGLCGAAEQDFTVEIEDDDLAFYMGANVEARLSARVSDSATIGLSGKAWWRSDAAEIRNPETGDDLFIRNSPTHLGTDDTHGASVSAFLTRTF